MSDSHSTDSIDDLAEGFEKIGEDECSEVGCVQRDPSPEQNNLGEPCRSTLDDSSGFQKSPTPPCNNLNLALTGEHTIEGSMNINQNLPPRTARMFLFSFSNIQGETATTYLGYTIKNKFPEKTFNIVEQEHNGKVYVYFDEELDARQLDVAIGGSLIQVAPLGPRSDTDECTAVHIQLAGNEILEPGDIQNCEKIIRLYLKNPAQSGGGQIEDIHYNTDNAQFTVTFCEASVARSVRERHGTDAFELDRRRWRISELKPVLPSPIISGETEPTRLIFTGLPATASRTQFEDYLQKWKQGAKKTLEYAVEPGVAMVEFHNEIDFSEYSRLVAQRPFLGTMISVQAVSSLRAIQIHGCQGQSEDHVRLHYEDDEPGVVANVRREGAAIIVTFYSKEAVARALQRDPLDRGCESQMGSSTKPYFEAFGLLPPSHNPSQPPIVCPNAEQFSVEVGVLNLIAKAPKLKASIERPMQEVHTRLVWPKDSDQPVRMECTLTNATADANRKLSTWRVDAVRAMSKACRLQTVALSGLPASATAQTIGEVLAQDPSVDKETLVVYDVNPKDKSAQATYRSQPEPTGQWKITIDQTEVLCEPVDCHGKRKSLREDGSRTIILTGLPGGPLVPEYVALLIENKSQSGRQSIDRLKYDSGLKKAAVLMRTQEEAEMFVEMNSSLLLGGQEVSVGLAEYNLPEEDHCYALRIVNARSIQQTEETELFLENKVPNFQLGFEHLDSGDTLVTCEDPRGISEIMRKHKEAPFTWNNVVLTIEELWPAFPPVKLATPSPTVALVTGLTCDIQEEELKTYLESTGTQVADIIISQDQAVRLVRFHTEPDFRRLWRLTDRCPLKGHMPVVQRMALPDTLEVLNTRGISSLKLHLYFENSGRSGGGPVSQLELAQGGTSSLVTFVSREVVGRVLDRQHSIDDKRLEVIEYYPEFGPRSALIPEEPGSELELATPGRIIKIRVDPAQLAWIVCSEDCKASISEALAQIGGKVQWQETSEHLRVAFVQGSSETQWKEWVHLVRDIIRQVVEAYFGSAAHQMM